MTSTVVSEGKAKLGREKTKANAECHEKKQGENILGT